MLWACAWCVGAIQCVSAWKLTACGAKSAREFAKLHWNMRLGMCISWWCVYPFVHHGYGQGSCSARLNVASMSEEEKYAWSVRCGARLRPSSCCSGAFQFRAWAPSSHVPLGEGSLVQFDWQLGIVFLIRIWVSHSCVCPLCPSMPWVFWAFALILAGVVHAGGRVPRQRPTTTRTYAQKECSMRLASFVHVPACSLMLGQVGPCRQARSARRHPPILVSSSRLL